MNSYNMPSNYKNIMQYNNVYNSTYALDHPISGYQHIDTKNSKWMSWYKVDGDYFDGIDDYYQLKYCKKHYNS